MQIRSAGSQHAAHVVLSLPQFLSEKTSQYLQRIAGNFLDQFPRTDSRVLWSTLRKGYFVNNFLGVCIRKSQISKNILRLLLLCFPIFCLADGIRKVDFAEYLDKVKALNSACGADGRPSFSGFCLSQEYGKVSYENPKQTSINLGLEIASLGHFYRSCDHSDVPSVSAVITNAKKVLDAAKYSELIELQKEALENYVGHFYFCKTKPENDVTLLNRLKWLEYTSGMYSANTFGRSRSVSNVVVSDVSTKYAAVIGNEPFSLICNGTTMLDTPCLVRFGSSSGEQPVRFVTQSTRYGNLLHKSIEKALTPEQNPRRPIASDIQFLQELAVDQCHAAAESEGISGDLLQLCIPSDLSKVVLFMRGLCDRCDFEPLVLERQVSP